MYIEVCWATVVFGRDGVENCTHLAKMHTLPLHEGRSWCGSWGAGGFAPAGCGCVQRHVCTRVCCFHFYTSSFLLVMAHWLLTSPRCSSARVPPFLSAVIFLQSPGREQEQRHNMMQLLEMLLFV